MSQQELHVTMHIHVIYIVYGTLQVTHIINT